MEKIEEKWNRTSLWTIAGQFQNMASALFFYIVFRIARFEDVTSPSFIGKNMIESLPEGNVVRVFLESFPTLLVDILAELIVPALIILVAIWGWLNIRWRITDSKIEFKKGLFTKTHQVMSRSKIQSVAVNTPFFGRLTRTQEIVISSGDDKDIIIGLIDKGIASEVRGILRSDIISNREESSILLDSSVVDGQAGYDVSSDSLPPRADGTFDEQQDLGDRALVNDDVVDENRYAKKQLAHLDSNKFFNFILIRNVLSLVLLVVALLVVAIAFFIFRDEIDSDFSFALSLSMFTGANFAVLIGFASIITGSIGTSLSFWDFKSWIEGRDIHTSQGLLSKSEKSAPLNRIQTLKIDQNPVRLFFKKDSVSVSTADGAIADVESLSNSVSLIDPVKEKDTWRDIASQIFDFEIPETLNPPSKKTIRRGIFRVLTIGISAALITGVAEYVFRGTFRDAAIIIVLTLLVAYPVGLLRYKSLGWAINEDCLLVRKGIIFRTTVLVPISLIQNISLHESIWARRLGLASVSVSIAGVEAPEVYALDLPREDAVRIFEQEIFDFNTDGV